VSRKNHCLSQWAVEPCEWWGLALLAQGDVGFDHKLFGRCHLQRIPTPSPAIRSSSRHALQAFAFTTLFPKAPLFESEAVENTLHSPSGSAELGGTRKLPRPRPTFGMTARGALNPRHLGHEERRLPKLVDKRWLTRLRTRNQIRSGMRSD
jgi:hypothetical protein